MWYMFVYISDTLPKGTQPFPFEAPTSYKWSYKPCKWLQINLGN